MDKLEANKDLFKSAYRCSPGFAEVALNAGADPNARQDDDGTTAILVAVKNLIRNQTARDRLGPRQLSETAKFCRVLLDHGADVNAADDLGNTALIAAAGRGHTETVALLLDRGADLSRKNGHGFTALEVAQRPPFFKVYPEHVAVAELLRAHQQAQSLAAAIPTPSKRFADLDRDYANPAPGQGEEEAEAITQSRGRRRL